MTRHVRSAKEAPSQESYRSLVPDLIMILSRNVLEMVPSALFSFENLTVLSLRNNQLRSIPPAIGRLRNLVELNLGANQLRSLPFEILQLVWGGRLDMLTVQPNPFMLPAMKVKGHDCGLTFQTCTLADVSGGTKTPLWKPTRLAVSPLTSFDLHGSRCKASPATEISETLASPQLSNGSRELQTSTAAEKANRLAPSLLELSLRSCSTSPSPSQLVELLPECPKPLIRLLQTAEAVKTAGGQECSVCGTPFVVARTEWVEWWYCEAPRPGARRWTCGWNNEEPVPLVRRGCSWRCTPSD